MAHSVKIRAGTIKYRDGGSHVVDNPTLTVTAPLASAVSHAMGSGARARYSVASGITTKNAFDSARSGVWT